MNLQITLGLQCCKPPSASMAQANSSGNRYLSSHQSATWFIAFQSTFIVTGSQAMNPNGCVILNASVTFVMIIVPPEGRVWTVLVGAAQSRQDRAGSSFCIIHETHNAWKFLFSATAQATQLKLLHILEPFFIGIERRWLVVNQKLIFATFHSMMVSNIGGIKAQFLGEEFGGNGFDGFAKTRHWWEDLLRQIPHHIWFQRSIGAQYLFRVAGPFSS
mmetsp:Transcript_1321/g.2904  ORF Transcript_1321/g.2904 Transcript_1321/m.2904 type:complete len:217 (+) Transcript_1321:285-935(+)